MVGGEESGVFLWESRCEDCVPFSFVGSGDTLVQYAACLPVFFCEEESRRHNSIPITLVGRVLQSFLFLTGM